MHKYLFIFEDGELAIAPRQLTEDDRQSVRDGVLTVVSLPIGEVLGADGKTWERIDSVHEV